MIVLVIPLETSFENYENISLMVKFIEMKYFVSMINE